jgi:hypothetical protein
MPMFLVTFMALLFWIATWLTIQIVCEPFRGGTQTCGLVRQADILSAFRLHGSGVRLRWAHRPGGLCSKSYLADNLNRARACQAGRNTGLGPVRQADILSAFRLAQMRSPTPLGAQT